MSKRSLFGKSKALVDSVTGLSNRTFMRTQGCWNCKHGSYELAKSWWKDKRQKDLNEALALSMTSPLGEQDPTCKNIRRMVDMIDHGVASGGLFKCMGHGVDANDNPIGDLVKSSYLCRKWSGAQGATVAREGEKADDLPMELEEKFKG